MYRQKGFTVDGKMTYQEYINSPAWAAKKLKFKRSGLFTGKCKACGSKDGIHLHHRTYKRLGAEWLQDLIELCGTCHFSGHDQGLENWKMHKLLRKDKRREARADKRQARVDYFFSKNKPPAPGTTFKLTEQLLHSVASYVGGWNKPQLALLGVPWPPVKGWLKGLVGKEMTAETWRSIVAAKC